MIFDALTFAGILTALAAGGVFVFLTRRGGDGDDPRREVSESNNSG
jgi:hypothetical protein